MSLSDQITDAESGGNANATNPNSSASGLGQFIDSTWVNLLRQHRPDLASGKSDSDLIAMKSDPDLSKQMVDAYAADNSQILAKNGLPVTSGTTYLAHFAGPNGAVSVLKADPNASAASILGPQAAKANPFLQNMTAGDLVNWANRKMGTSGPGPSGSAPGGQGSAPQPSSPGILGNAMASGTASPAAAASGILNAPADDGLDIAAFQKHLAQLAAQYEQPTAAAPQLAPIPMAMPRGLPRARLLAALQSPIGG